MLAKLNNIRTSMKLYNNISLLLMCNYCIMHNTTDSYSLHNNNLNSNGHSLQYSNGQEWTDCFGNDVKNPESDSNNIKIISYNVLGPLHGESMKHNYAPISVTKWTRRRDRLLDELRAMKGDIYCLQEVSERALPETFIPGLARIGLVCSGYAPNKLIDKGEHRPRGKLAHRNIGCAMFTNPDKIEVISSKRVHLKNFAPLHNCQSRKYYFDIHSKWNTMVMMLVRLKTTNQLAIVANTHLFWDPERADIKTIQTYSAANALSKFAKELGFNKDSDGLPPLILCGDFNVMPLDFSAGSFGSSGTFEVLQTSKLSTTHPQHPDNWYPLLPGNSNSDNPKIGDLAIDWKMTNTYLLPEFASQTPYFTTKTDDFQGWIDHIWVNEKVQVNYVLRPPVIGNDVNAVLKSKDFLPIPNKSFASDHIPIGIIAQIVDNESNSSDNNNNNTTSSTANTNK